MGCLEQLTRLRGKRVRERSRKRVVKVLSFMLASETPQHLRRTVLCLQVADHALRVSSQLCDKGELLLARLSKGVVERGEGISLGLVGPQTGIDPGV